MASGHSGAPMGYDHQEPILEVLLLAGLLLVDQLLLARQLLLGPAVEHVQVDQKIELLLLGTNVEQRPLEHAHMRLVSEECLALRPC